MFAVNRSNDRLSPEQRSAHMQLIRKVDTKPELVVRRLAHHLGYRFRLHRRDLPGTPDLVFPRLGKVILVHGCFWHQHPGCRFARTPKSRLDYWLPKLRRNQERDTQATKSLACLGWAVLVLWECEVLMAETVAVRVDSFLRN
jgi:DNA mismatch endonuclease, patch repair protein